MSNAIGMIETKGFVAALAAADAMVGGGHPGEDHPTDAAGDHVGTRLGHREHRHRTHAVPDDDRPALLIPVRGAQPGQAHLLQPQGLALGLHQGGRRGAG